MPPLLHLPAFGPELRGFLLGLGVTSNLACLNGSVRVDMRVSVDLGGLTLGGLCVL